MEKIVFLLPLVLLTSCSGGQLQTAKRSLVAAHSVYIEIDSSFSSMYEQARENARLTSESWEERDAKLEQWEKAKKSLISTGYALKTAAMSIDIAEEGLGSDWRIQIKKVTEAFDSLCKCLEAVDIRIPKKIDKVLKILKVVRE